MSSISATISQAVATDRAINARYPAPLVVEGNGRHARVPSYAEISNPKILDKFSDHDRLMKSAGWTRINAGVYVRSMPSKQPAAATFIGTDQAKIHRIRRRQASGVFVATLALAALVGAVLVLSQFLGHAAMK